MYIGITSQPLIHRWGKDGHGYFHQQLFNRAITKYGWDGFDHIVLGRGLNKENACKMEALLIAQYQSNNPDYGYNCSIGGEVSALGFRHTTEAKAKISEAGKLNPPTKLCLEKSKSALIKPVKQYDLNGNLITIFNSQTTACVKYGVSTSAISRCCNGKLKTVSGFVWRYINDDFNKYDTVNRSRELQKKPVYQYDMTGALVAKYESCMEASRLTQLSQGNIGSCCRGERRQTGGYTWEYRKVI